jgi:hypothetical protein
MVDSDEKPGTEELLARIAKLEADVARLAERAELVKNFSRLKAKVDVLWDGFMEYRNERNKWFEDAFDRIMNLEMFVFPKLFTDMSSVHRIIGLEADKNPLDSRETFPSKNNPDRTD